ncbi:MAG: sigma-70 family RNA polymerase sigma factor [Candidatus Parcubacteria bacterium]|nr:sigma-70 family RNA polymerase sigma factor [Candidatus Parcubacteria bacterium]
MDNFTDQKLINAYLLNHDQAALEILIGRYFQAVYRFVYYFVKNNADAQDITQNAFIKVWSNLKKFDHKKNFKSWLYIIAKNTALDFFRRKKDLTFSELNASYNDINLEEAYSDPAPLPSEIWDRQNLAEELSRILDKLPFSYRLVVSLHYKDGLTFFEISEILNKPLNTVKSQHLRAITQLRRLLIKK